MGKKHKREFLSQHGELKQFTHKIDILNVFSELLLLKSIEKSKNVKNY